jgi:hypothetical protein
MTQQDNKNNKPEFPEVDSFVYVPGDKDRAPVVLADQKPGTNLVLVASNGKEYQVVAGSFRIKPEMTPELQAKLDKMKKYDPESKKFPNLSDPREE